MDPPLRSNGSTTRPPAPASPRSANRSRTTAKVERALNAALAGDQAAVLSITASELLTEPGPVADAIAEALDRPGVGVLGHAYVHSMLRRSGLNDELFNALTSPNSLTRAAAARLCGALRLTESVIWLEDLMKDPTAQVREAAVRSLAQVGGHRTVEILMRSDLPLYRLVISLARAATDLDVEAFLRGAKSEREALATVLACGLRRDVLRISPLMGIAHDRRWPKQVRAASIKSLAMIGDRSAADGLRHLAAHDQDEDLKKTATRAHKRLLRRALAKT